MEELFGKFVMSYLLMPLVAVLLGSVMFFIAKKNQLLRNKRLIGLLCDNDYYVGRSGIGGIG